MEMFNIEHYPRGHLHAQLKFDSSFIVFHGHTSCWASCQSFTSFIELKNWVLGILSMSHRYVVHACFLMFSISMIDRYHDLQILWVLIEVFHLCNIRIIWKNVYLEYYVIRTKWSKWNCKVPWPLLALFLFLHSERHVF